MRVVQLLVCVLLLAPGALADATEEAAPEDASAPSGGRREVPIPEGYTGAGREPYLSYFEGVWLYGSMIATPIGQQRPRDLDVDGDWVVWEDASRSDIFAYSISASQGFYVTSDPAVQRNPRVDGNVIVYEDYSRLNRPAIMAYFLDTGETRRLTNGSTIVRDADIDHPYVAWVDENRTNPDIWAYSLLNDTAWSVHPGTDRDADPLVHDGRVYWRSYRYTLWDVMAYEVETGDTIQITSDRDMQAAPFTNGEDVFYLTNYMELGWRVDRYDPELDEERPTTILLPDSRAVSASGDAMLRVAQDVEYAELVVRNLTSGATNHVTGDLLLAADPVIQDRTIFAPVRTKLGTSLLVLEVSPFAFAKRPTLTLATPGPGTPWMRPLIVSGTLEAGPEFTEPVTFTYRIDDEPPQPIPPGRSWRFTLDPAGYEPGTYTVTIRATFREGPPLTTGVTLAVPSPGATVDVERAGPAFHAARIAGEFNTLIVDNPASWILIPLVLILLVLVILRLYLAWKPRSRRVAAEYVPPDEHGL